jgi:hypothetical protein
MAGGLKMNRAQKISLTLFIAISLGLFIVITVVLMRPFDAGVPKIAFVLFVLAVAVAGSGGIISIFYFKKDKDAEKSDKRDKLAENNASLWPERIKIMTKLQKQAWGILFVTFAVCPILAILVTLTEVKYLGMPLSIKLVAHDFASCTTAVFMPLALNAFYIVRKPKQWKGVYPYDERDQLILYRALLCVFYTLCTIFAAGSIILPSAIFFLSQSIPIYILLLCFSGLAILTVFVYSVAILVQYGRSGDGDK